MKITKKELREIIQEVAEEMGLLEGLTAAQEKLPEPLKKAILKKQGNGGDSDDKDAADDEDENVEEGLTAAQEKLPEPLKKAILKKQGNGGESTEEDDEESIEEGNAFGAAVKAARENGDTEFEVSGKTYKLREILSELEETEEFVGEEADEELEEGVCETCEEDDDVEEGNAFGDAVKKAKEAGETEFEVDGKTYKVRENWSKITLSEKLDRMLGNKKVL